ncbi:MAG: tetratricopeptide repeat protein, partial [Candidatus Fonsibacter sp.]
MVSTSGGTDKISFEYLVKTLGIYKTTVGDRNSKVAYTLNRMALVYAGQGTFVLALVNYSKAMDINVPMYGENHLDSVLSCPTRRVNGQLQNVRRLRCVSQAFPSRRGAWP